jgi:MinD-like ATPase involved in chromosome partitioning or flagellar assembly
MLSSSTNGSAHALPDPTIEVLDLLARRFPEHRTGIHDSGRLQAAVRALISATAMTPEQAAAVIGERDLQGAQKPIDVLTSRCMNAIQRRPEDRREEAARPEGPRRDTEMPVHEGIEPQHSPPAARAAGRPWQGSHTAAGHWWQLGQRGHRGVGLVPPVIDTPNLERIVQPITGNRYVSVWGAVGGAGSTTLSVLLGSVLATCRPDRVVVTEASSSPHALGDRAGVTEHMSVRALLTHQDQISGCVEVSKFVGRTASRVDTAILLPGDAALDADEYRNASAILARFYDLMISDVGASNATPALEPIAALSDIVVVATSPTAHGWRSADRLLNRLAAPGFGPGPTQIVVVVNGAHRRNPINVDEMSASLRSKCADVIRVPWDPKLASGDAIDLRALHRFTLSACTTLAAATVDGLVTGHSS